MSQNLSQNNIRVQNSTIFQIVKKIQPKLGKKTRSNAFLVGVLHDRGNKVF